ncbi:MAG: electron transfer flavoprotein subunit alpha/FixB family protein [Acidobacteria bacterium]|nr:electron transfer flavoprotein subunit alpha/FixB family protein [Acidobacteriota bacterium]
MSEGILLFIEQRDGKLNRTSLETLVAVQKIAATTGDTTSAVVLGQGINEVATEIAAKKLAKVYTVEDDKLATYTPDAYVGALKQVIEKLNPRMVAFSHTYRVRDFAPRLTAALGKTFVTDCISFRQDGNDTVFTRQIFQGKINTDVRVQSAPPIFVSFQAGSYRADLAEVGDAPAAVEALAVDLSSVDVRTQTEAPFQEAKQAVDLTQAPLIVAIGRGIKEKDNIKIIEDLAAAMGAEIAASRPICDNEWLPMDRQIGSSGQTVAPKLYLAIGISGAIQHVVGMKNSQTIVAINKDPEAPIFDIADYGIVGDLFDIIPALTAEVKKAKGE